MTMRGKILSVFAVLLLSVSCTPDAQDSNVQNVKGMHTIGGTVPLYVDGNVSQSPRPALSPALIAQVKSTANLGDALRVLGPAYMAAGDSYGVARWYFSDNTTLTLWPQGGETVSDVVTVHPHPNCGTNFKDCKVLVLSREPFSADYQTGRKPRATDELDGNGQRIYTYNTQSSADIALQQTGDAVGNTFLGATSNVIQNWGQAISNRMMPALPTVPAGR
jgi:hypothetical protein